MPSRAVPRKVSAAPSPFISAVSIKVMPRSMPVRRAAISHAHCDDFSPMRQVPWPSDGTDWPWGRSTVRIGGLWRLLCRQDGNLVYLRWLGQQLARFFHERCGHLTVKMCLPILIAVKRVKDRELARRFFYCVPVQGSRFGLNQGKRGSKKLSDFALFPGLSFQRHIKRKFCHDHIPERETK